MPAAAAPPVEGVGAMARVVGVIGISATAALAGCAGTRIADGVFHSSKGYQVALPTGTWEVHRDRRSDLELRLSGEPVGMLVNATCDGGEIRAPMSVLARHLLTGFRERSIITSEDLSLDGRTGRHSVLEGRMAGGGEPMKLELYVLRDRRCVYDLVFAAPPASFAEWQPAFRRLVESFRAE